MFKIALIVLLALGCNAATLGGQFAANFQRGSYQTAQQPPLQQQVQSYSAPVVARVNTYAAPVSYAAPVQQNYGPIEAAIQTRRTSELRSIALQQDLAQPQTIIVSPDELPVNVHFRTTSSRVSVQQSHNPGVAGPVEHASFQDQPHRVVHEVVKPIIQEVREIIQPYRRVTQEIRPVIEEVHTIVHKGEGRRALPVAAAPSYAAAPALALNNGYKAAKAAKAA